MDAQREKAVVSRDGTVVIVLAAGSGKRFAGDATTQRATDARHKLAQPFGASTVLGTTIDCALASHLPVIVVTTAELQPEATQRVAARDLVLLPAADGESAAAPLGMGYSIAAGVAARPNARGWLVLPGDMPLVRSQTLVALARELPKHAIVYAQHQGRRGHPVGFAAELYSELATLSGDEGARRLLGRYPAQALECGDAGVVFDIDTRADLEAARALHRAQAEAA
ncbi:nucleotidyltransferase family protein [Caldimonas sp. KR1-144]|uniref:nucleotidyltransferase family protein n=1 Tax=Caldimonas sp. KR1-144 TaxID=3400911 RepID=UPI003C0080B4